MIRCSEASAAADEQMIGTAPRADVWIVVEHPDGWGDAPLTRSEHDVRIVMARGSRDDSARTRARGTCRVWLARCAAPGRSATLRVGTVADPDEVAGWDLRSVAAGERDDWGRASADPLLLVCANGRRDRCCGHAGGRLSERLWAGDEPTIRADQVLTSTHLGGHRFAPTALLLPWGVLHGRLEASDAAGLLGSAARGTTPTPTLRGFSAHEPAAQVAEAHIRRVTGHTGLAPLPVEVTGGGTDVRAIVHLEGSTHTVHLTGTSMPIVASCGRAPQPVTHWIVTEWAVGPLAAPAH